MLISCATPNKNGISKPTLATSVPSYLDTFPLNQVSKDALIQTVGLPDKSSKIDGKVYLSYEMGTGFGKRQWIYEITDNIVSNVRYHDSGPYNGMSAKTRQQAMP